MPTPPVETFPMPALNSEPDTRITIFNHIEFHLHSSLLKLHSAYFRKFIDSLDNALEPSGAQWKYDWIAKVEGDGNWYVVKKAQESQGQENIAFRNPTISAFRCMIKVMYLIPYVIESTKNLQEITELGGFYCCLPAVSISLYSSFYCSPSFIANLYNDREILLGVANKLRHKELFSDCLSLISGRWDPNDQSFTTGIGDKKLAVLAVDMHNRLGGKLAYAHQTILKGLPTGYTAAAW